MRYTQYFNSQRHVQAHLWQGRFYSSILADAHAFEALRKNLKTGKPCGSLEFVRQLEVLLGRKLERRPRKIT